MCLCLYILGAEISRRRFVRPFSACRIAPMWSFAFCNGSEQYVYHGCLLLFRWSLSKMFMQKHQKYLQSKDMCQALKSVPYAHIHTNTHQSLGSSVGYSFVFRDRSLHLCAVRKSTNDIEPNARVHACTLQEYAQPTL